MTKGTLRQFTKEELDKIVKAHGSKTLNTYKDKCLFEVLYPEKSDGGFCADCSADNPHNEHTGLTCLYCGSLMWWFDHNYDKEWTTEELLSQLSKACDTYPQ